MEALGSGDDRASPASSTRSLDLRRLSTRADSAYSSFSAASGGPEARTPSPSTPYLDWEYVRVVWGGPSPAPPDADSPTAQRPRPAVAACCGPRPPEVQGTLGPLSRQATPLLYALAAEAEAGERAAEPPSPPASRAAYRQRLQGAQRRVLRETSFQRKELRMSLPTRLRPAVLARPPTAHPRSASLSHPGGEVGSVRSRAPAPGTPGPGRLADQQRKWCFSEPGKLDRVGRGGGPAGKCLSPEPRELQRGAWAGAKGLPEAQRPNAGELDSRSMKLGDACRSASRSQSASGDVLGPWRSPGGTRATVQAVSQAAENPRSMFQTKLSSTKNFLPGHCGQWGIPASQFLTQKEAALMHPAEDPQSSPAKCEQRVSEIYMESASAWLPSLPNDEVFLEETLHVGMRSPPDSHVPQRFPTSFTQLLPTSQKEIRPENSPSHPVPDRPSAQGLPASNNSIQAKKVELVGLLQKMLQDLHVQEERLQGAAQEWTRRRVALESVVGRVCAPQELERFSRFMADLERVLSLLLLLGSRLARVHCALARVDSDGDPDEQASLLQRLGLLQRQQEDAKELKEHVARRERALREALARALSAEELRSYSELLTGKATILAQQRSLDERVRLLQNQLDTLGSDFSHRPLSPRRSWTPGTCPRDKPSFLPSSI
ncbi:protein Shroom1 isoform X2 [Sciurus carolinensis]|uniref:protein Shroom1 isoform X2 n=1 Tax=Sciurus carolinensis TaxID=30640 RepID=UPI001FB3100E|nr:protein Shroom1 isoform X2 [Sciurus carolinensis]